MARIATLATCTQKSLCGEIRSSEFRQSLQKQTRVCDCKTAKQAANKRAKFAIINQSSQRNDKRQKTSISALLCFACRKCLRCSRAKFESHTKALKRAQNSKLRRKKQNWARIGRNRNRGKKGNKKRAIKSICFVIYCCATRVCFARRFVALPSAESKSQEFGFELNRVCIDFGANLTREQKPCKLQTANWLLFELRLQISAAQVFCLRQLNEQTKLGSRSTFICFCAPFAGNANKKAASKKRRYKRRKLRCRCATNN